MELMVQLFIQKRDFQRLREFSGFLHITVFPESTWAEHRFGLRARNYRILK